MRLFIISIYTALLLIISPPSLSAYTTMTLEGVKQANGVWTAAGVMDTSGFVRTTGSLTVAGSTASTAVSLPVDRVAASAMLRSASRLAGPAALALSAYDVYEWVKSSGEITDSNGEWVLVPDSIIDSYGYYWQTQTTPSFLASNGLAAAYAYDESNVYYKDVSCSRVTDTQYNCVMKHNSAPSTTMSFSVNRKTCTSSQSSIASCAPPAKPTESNFDKLGIAPFPILSSGFSKIPSLIGQPIPLTGTGFSFPPFSEWMGTPYFKDGQWYRDRMDISPCPTSSQPNRVCVDIGPQKFEGATDPNTVPSQATGTATGSTPKEQTDFCKKNPQSIACQELGQLEQEPFDPIEKPFQITPQNPWGSGDAQCPAPKVMQLSTGSIATLSYQPACDFFRGVRPAVLALAMLAALYIALGIPVGKGD
ncbi:virulence factor TspB C-terminal domain-related protein [Aeromonas veronii]